MSTLDLSLFLSIEFNPLWARIRFATSIGILFAASPLAVFISGRPLTYLAVALYLAIALLISSGTAVFSRNALAEFAQTGQFSALAQLGQPHLWTLTNLLIRRIPFSGALFIVTISALRRAASCLHN